MCKQRLLMLLPTNGEWNKYMHYLCPKTRQIILTYSGYFGLLLIDPLEQSSSAHSKIAYLNAEADTQTFVGCSTWPRNTILHSPWNARPIWSPRPWRCARRCTPPFRGHRTGIWWTPGRTPSTSRTSSRPPPAGAGPGIGAADATPSRGIRGAIAAGAYPAARIQLSEIQV